MTLPSFQSLTGKPLKSLPGNKNTRFQKTAWLALGVFLLGFSTTSSVVDAQAPLKKTKAAEQSKKKWKVIDGFRSAQFGMKEKQVLRAIAKDFKISKNRVKRKVQPVQKTTNLNIKVPDLMAIGGTAHIVYILGHKSKRLMQVNVVWGIGVTEHLEAKEVISAGNLLRTHYIKKKYKKEKYAVNAKVSDTKVLIFRGQDKKGRMILLGLTTSKTSEVKAKKDATNKVILKLSYIHNPYKPDVLKAKGK